MTAQYGALSWREIRRPYSGLLRSSTMSPLAPQDGR